MTVQATMTKRRKESPLTSRVDELPAHILRSIFHRINFNDLVQAKSVCRSWNLLGDELTSKMPWLMLPSKKQVEEGDGINVNNNGYHGFLNLMENHLYSLKTTPKEFSECCCIGSSHGWLVFLQEKAVPFLFNPFKQVKIELPSVDRLLGLEKMKAILNDNGNCGLVLLCNNGEEIAYNAIGSDYWTVLDVLHPPYQDIICHRNRLYALSDKNSIKVWDLNIGGNHVVKKSDFVYAFPEKSLAEEKSLRDVCTCRFYLVESCGDLLFVVRFIGDYVDWDGTLLHEHDLLTEASNHPKVCPFRILFHVYKRDFNELNDDCWERMEEDYLYGELDMGIYNLKGGSLKPVFEFSSDKIQPDPAMFES
ncbi:hypothetical protein F3Y22_tig00110044pilonHSYRG00441 [Hibiscus syriacus]|uniref:F-box domain-containing protein n=1 Tax=Hibiscus syriacus TaxID=106335 RepID=A0A6A3BPE3_HIBSY|nr:F-box protein At2g05970-like [Hibiscus syriacus]KAE8717701.1 hypothetical protein F3Y22_tig00110044pilonHSYRG00441 [Hibiscus syriacus]